MTDPGRVVAMLWARRDARRRWGALLTLGLLAGITGGVAMSAVAGARRTATALPRLEQATSAGQAMVFPSQVGDFTPNVAALAAKPEVKTIALWDLLFGAINGQPGNLIFGSDNGAFQGIVDRPLVVKGRMYNPKAPDEMVVDEAAAAYAPLGTTITFQAAGPDQASDSSSASPDGPSFTLHVVGVVKDIDQFLFVPDGQGFVSPAFVEDNRSRILVLSNAEVALNPGEGGVAALQRDADATLAPGVPVLDFARVSRRVTTTLGVERIALLLLGAAVALAGGFLIVQALARSAATIGDDVAALRAIGLTRGDVAYASALAHSGTVVVAVLAAFATALGMSDAFPIGLGRQVDPNAGFHIDWTILGPGTLTLALLLAVGSYVAARRTYRASGTQVVQPSGLVAWIRRWAPVSVGLGAGMAFERGTAARTIPVRPALAGAVVGVMGVVATLGINQGINYALHHPELAGVTWDAEVNPNPSDMTPRNVSPSLDAAVEAAAGAGAAVAVRDRSVVQVNGVGVPAFSLRAAGAAGPSPIAFTVVSGRAPTSDSEAAIGPASAKELGVHVGETVRVGTNGDHVRLVAEALFPTNPHSEFDEGLWLSPATYDAEVPPAGPSFNQGQVDRLLAIRAAPGHSASALLASLDKSVAPQAAGGGPPTLPQELVNLKDVGVLPAALAVFLALVATAAVSLALVISTRRRRRDFAVLRALGMAPAGARLVLNSQSTAMGLFGLLLGAPLGLAAGRLSWQLVAERVPLQVAPPTVLLAVLAAIPATMLIVNVLAVLPGRSVARRAVPAVVLRAE